MSGEDDFDWGEEGGDDKEEEKVEKPAWGGKGVPAASKVAEAPKKTEEPAPTESTPAAAKPTQDDQSPSRTRRQQPEATPIPNEPPFKAYVGSIPYNSTQQDVRDFFESKGSKVKEVLMPRDGLAFVEFEDQEGLKQAIQFNGQELKGRALRIYVSKDEKGERRPREGRNYRDRDDKGEGRGRFDRGDRGDRGGRYESRGEGRGRGRGGYRDRDDKEEGGRGRYNKDNRERGDKREGSDDTKRGDRPERGAGRGWSREETSTEKKPEGETSAASPTTKESTSPTSDSKAESSNTTTDSNSSENPQPAREKREKRSGADPFGGAKPRDEAAAQRAADEVRANLKSEDPKTSNSNSSNNNNSGTTEERKPRAERGERSGGRGRGRGDRDNTNKDANKSEGGRGRGGKSGERWERNDNNRDNREGGRGRGRGKEQLSSRDISRAQSNREKPPKKEKSKDKASKGAPVVEDKKQTETNNVFSAASEGASGGMLMDY